MTKNNDVTQEHFALLLRWLDPDPDVAAQKYGKIQERLVRFFAGRGCCEAEAMVDKTFDRVARKLPQIIDTYTGEPVRYFYGVAHKIFLEWLREQEKFRNLPRPEPPPAAPDDDDDRASEYACLEKCLGTLPGGQRQLIVDYFTEEKRAKIDLRRKLALELGITTNALQIRICRIRAELEKCIRGCLAAQAN